MNKIISLGLGVQSTALYYMSSIGEMPKLDMAIFADTGGEKRRTMEYYQFLLNWQKQNKGIPIYKAAYRNLMKDIETNDYTTPSIPVFYKGDDGERKMVMRRCTYEYKMRQINKKYREVLNLPTPKAPFPKTEIWIGITMEEQDRMAKPSYKEKWKVNVYPFCGYKIYPNGKHEKMDRSMIRTRSAIYDWYRKNNLPIPVKSSCVFCPFMSDSNWSEMKKNAKDDWKDALKVDDQIRKQGNSYLHQSLMPLKDVQFREKAKGFFDDLGNCSDYCNI